MHDFFIGWNFFSILLLGFFIVYSAKRRSRLSNCMIAMSSLVASCLLTYSLSFFITNTKLVYTLAAVYHISDLWVHYAIFVFVISLTEISKGKIIKNFNTCIFFSLAILDAVLCVINIFSHIYYEMVPVYYPDGKLFYWGLITKSPFYLHTFLNLLMVCQNVGSLLVRSIKLPRFYRTKYIGICVMFLIVIFSDLTAKINHIEIDGTLSMYILLAGYAFYLAFFGVNKSLLDSMLSLVSENISHAVTCFDSYGKCFYLNRQARNIFGSGEQGFSSAECYRDKLRIQYPEKMFNYLKLTQTFPLADSVHTYECEYKILKDSKSRAIVSYLKFEDITEDLALLEQEKFRTEHDRLTKLYNRNFFFTHAAEILRIHKDTDFLIMATNIMDFKVVNSLFGEEIGDEILKLMAAILTANQCPNSVIGRISGDRFAMLMPRQYFKTEDLMNNHSQLQQAVDKYHFRLQNYIGVYEISDHFENVKTMYDKATMTIDSIRGSMEKTVAFYNTSLLDKQIRDKKIVSEFESALMNGEFVMYLQPQIRAGDGKVNGAEALVRRIIPGRGMVSPAEFIPVLEKSGLIHKLDQYMWELAAKKLYEWKTAGIDMYISINISSKDFYYIDVCDYLTKLVEKYQIEAGRLNIEITETVLMQDVTAHREGLQKLHAAGFSIEMDDFGSGYSSLSTLKNLEMNTLKIDMGFLRNSDFSKKSRDIISAIITMSKKLGMTVITEGVETSDQAEFLKEAGCDIFQGFYFSRPVSVEEFEKTYQKGGRQ